MRLHARMARWTGIGAALLALAVAPRPAHAFDTGHHFDITREVLQEEKFAETPIKAVQVQNWLVDYFSNSPSPGSDVEDHVNTLHADNLFTTEQARNYWCRLGANTKSAVEQAAQSRDALKLLSVTGMTLHAVQDFYSHSNWVELHPRSAGGPYRTETWTGGPLPASMTVFTGRASHYKGPPPPAHVQNHGGYSSGMNHDDYGRPRWDEAYVFAYVASREWVAAIRTWANAASPGFWDAARAWVAVGSDRSALDRDYEAAYRVSEWIALRGEDGHWKGKGSGSNADLVAFMKDWGLAPDGAFVRQFKGSNATVRLLSSGLSGPNIAAVTAPEVPALSPLAVKAVIVRTLSVKEKGDDGVFETTIDPAGSPDFFAKVTVNGQTFVEAMQLDKKSITPAWTTIKFVPASTTGVTIRYELWDEDARNDDHVDINPAEGKRDLNFIFNLATRMCTGDVSGVYDSAAKAVTSDGRKGDSNRAVVQFYVTTADLARK